MGALAYEPELLPEKDGQVIDLADIAAQSEKVLRGETSDVLEELRICGGSPGGARPKVTVAFSEDMTGCQANFSDLPQNYSHWIVNGVVSYGYFFQNGSLTRRKSAQKENGDGNATTESCRNKDHDPDRSGFVGIDDGD